MRTLASLIEENKITMLCKRTNSNPLMDDMGEGARHWHITLINGKSGKRFRSLKYSQGSAHTESPDVENVLDCLASDSLGIENCRSFNEWCSDYGYNTDSRRAWRIYTACKKQAEKLKEFMGKDYGTLLFDVERL